ncbi:unnamed protein product [Tilletia laevis]|uniref:Integrase catalytic domain-containing protein n=2 Tax=Tilletia TaxID=13289 RepID=A0A9N8LZY2_9BASI|nr:unnamed protein product [Tilletia caries]CAD6930827.1 unnamed protein product [Tilletia caries]CAD6947086.1 unnamed protein product [Tilletia laevis]
MTPHAWAFSTLQPDSTVIVTADGKRTRAVGKGTVTLLTTAPNETYLTLYDVLHVPGLEFNLISVFKLNEDHLRVEFTEQLNAVVTDPFDQCFVITAPWSPASQAYLIPMVGNTEITAFITAIMDEERSGASDGEELAPSLVDSLPEWLKVIWALWHERLGHMGNSSLPHLAKNSTGLPEQLAKRSRLFAALCEVCSLTNIKRSPFPTSTTKTTCALELVHADLTGRLIVPSLGGAEYLAVLVDDYTRMVWVLSLARKSDFVSKFSDWLREVVSFKGPIACLRTDGGVKLDNAAIRAVISGARQEKSCAYTAQQNGVAERYVGLIKNTMRPLLHARQLPLEYWGEAASTAAYLRNLSSSSVLGGKTPFEIWHGTLPDLSILRVFGCLAFARLSDKARKHSLAFRSRAGVFVGYDKERKGYKIHFPDTGETTITTDADFHEDKAYDFTTISHPEEPTRFPAELPQQQLLRRWSRLQQLQHRWECHTLLLPRHLSRHQPDYQVLPLQQLLFRLSPLRHPQQLLLLVLVCAPLPRFSTRQGSTRSAKQ